MSQHEGFYSSATQVEWTFRHRRATLGRFGMMGREKSATAPLALLSANIVKGDGGASPPSTEIRECANSYSGELFRQGRFRVILCRDGIQWILQRQKGHAGEGAGPRWQALGYFVTREALARLWHQKTGVHSPQIAAMPDRLRRNLLPVRPAASEASHG